MYKVIGQSIDNNDFSVYVISQFSHIHIHMHTHIRLSENQPLVGTIKCIINHDQHMFFYVSKTRTNNVYSSFVISNIQSVKREAFLQLIWDLLKKWIPKQNFIIMVTFSVLMNWEYWIETADAQDMRCDGVRSGAINREIYLICNMQI